jgi:hypothetical protein
MLVTRVEEILKQRGKKEFAKYLKVVRLFGLTIPYGHLVDVIRRVFLRTLAV